ncbi:hypothetical protein ACH5RR_015157 [Cinchona calisaya]|uniref:Uncharacterized protein n=1 Tax=Cinchona calisaya TaxID=153742 RepID=A0ABD2ZTJ5_9GENT
MSKSSQKKGVSLSLKKLGINFALKDGTKGQIWGYQQEAQECYMTSLRRKTLEEQAAWIPVEDKGCSSKTPIEQAVKSQEVDDTITELPIEEISFDPDHPDRKLRSYSALPST